MGEAVRIHPYSVLGRWNAVKGRFPDIRGLEETHDVPIACVERQAAFVAARTPSLIGDDIIQAYAVVGLSAIEG